jgi:hypothetical protein
MDGLPRKHGSGFKRMCRTSGNRSLVVVNVYLDCAGAVMKMPFFRDSERHDAAVTEHNFGIADSAVLAPSRAITGSAHGVWPRSVRDKTAEVATASAGSPDPGQLMKTPQTGAGVI